MTRISAATLAVVIIGCCCNPERGNGPGELTVSVGVTGPGSVPGASPAVTVHAGETLMLTAVPDSNGVFAGWDTGAFTAANPLAVQVISAKTIRAVFVLRPGDVVPIPARDSVFLMGSAASTAQPFEKPQHRVRFTYDFFMGDREVTSADYRGTIPATATDSMPVTRVTWYDAALYCNRRSKDAGYDTVYSYTARCPQAGKCPYILENLVVHYDRFGYRLPTEAEWEYACRAGSTGEFFWGDDLGKSGEYAWYFGNSENRLHAGGGKLPNRFGLYDMAGNAAELVNDWLGLYRDSLLVDPVGPTHLTQEQFEALWNRPLKGGSYRLAAPYLQSAGRKGPYDMKYVEALPDIGFRVVLGTFGAPSPPPAVVVSDSLAAAIACNKSDLISIVGTSRIKAAIVYSAGRNRYCAYIDFDASPVRIVKCGSDSNVYAPVFSPDGRYLAWGSNDEGSSGKGTITICRMADDFPVVAQLPGFLPRFWTNLETNDTCLIYTDGASSNDQPQWYREKTLRISIAGGKPQGSAEVLWGAGSYHGGLSSNGRFLGTAYPQAKAVDLKPTLLDTNVYYFVPPWNGRNDTPQVCNFSMSPSRNRLSEALLLDFGYSGISTLLKRSYGLHEVIFVANAKLFNWDQVPRWYVIPSEYSSWNRTEWTNFPGAISALAMPQSDTGGVTAMLIQCRDSVYLPLVKGPSLCDVAVWINPADISETVDKYGLFGEYDVPIQTSGQIHLARKMRLFWHMRERISCIAIGNSPTYYGFEPHGVTSLPSLNIGWPQSSIGTSLTVALQYVLPHAPHLRAIVLDLDASYLDVDSRTAKPLLTGLYDSEGYELDMANDFYRSGLPPEVAAKAAAFESTAWDSLDTSGAILNPTPGYGWGEAIIEGRGYSIDDSIVRSNLAYLQEMVDSAAGHGVHVLAVNYPQNPGYRSTDMVGRAGPDRATWLQLASLLRTMEQKNTNFYFYDANNLGEHDYTSDEAFDTNHLNPRGGLKIAARIDSVLQAVLK